jgi:hypothetical protein
VSRVASKAIIPTTIAVEPIKVVAGIIMEELGLDSKHIMLEYEKNLMPEDTALYVALNYIGPEKVIANVNEMDENQNEVQTATIQHMVQVDMLSFGPEARLRKEELAMALFSIYSQQQQEANSMMIARCVAPLINASSFEATKWLNRFTTSFAVHAVHRKVKPAQYYNEFSAQFSTEQIGPVEADPAQVPA